MALELIEIKDFPKTASLTGSGDEIIPVSKADGKTYGIKTSDLKAFLGTVQSIAPKPLSPADPAPTLDGVYKPTITQNEAGTPIIYTNAGNLSVNTAVGGADYGKSVELINNGGVWTKIGVVLPVDPDRIRNWVISESFTIQNYATDSFGNISSANITYPDGKLGTISNVMTDIHGKITSIRYNYGAPIELFYTVTITYLNNQIQTSIS